MTSAPRISLCISHDTPGAMPSEMHMKAVSVSLHHNCAPNKVADAATDRAGAASSNNASGSAELDVDQNLVSA